MRKYATVPHTFRAVNVDIIACVSVAMSVTTSKCLLFKDKGWSSLFRCSVGMPLHLSPSDVKVRKSRLIDRGACAKTDPVWFFPSEKWFFFSHPLCSSKDVLWSLSTAVHFKSDIQSDILLDTRSLTICLTLCVICFGTVSPINSKWYWLTQPCIFIV